MAEYRVREARVLVTNGYTDTRKRMFIAERRVSFFGMFSFWSICTSAGWRTHFSEAQNDAEADASLHAPLSEPVVFECVKHNQT